MPRAYGEKGTGAVWAHKKINDRQPDFRGHIDLSREQLRALVDQAKAGDDQTFKILVAMWDRMSKKGEPYKYLATEVLIENGDSHPPEERQAAPKASKPWD